MDGTRRGVERRGSPIDLPLSPVPAGPADLTSEVVTRVVGRPVAVTEVTRVGAEFGFSGETYRLTLRGPEAPAAVIAKLWALRDAEDVLEVYFYRELAAATPARLPALIGGGVDPEQSRAWLVLEALEDFRQGDCLVGESLDTVLRLTETLARTQAAWWDRIGDRAWLPRAPRFRRDAEYLRSRRLEYLDRFGPLRDPVTRRLFDEIPAMVVVADELLSEAPDTLLHLDVSLDNVLFLGPADHPILIDWARCGRGPGVLDLASVLFTTAPLSGFGAVVDGYVAELQGSNVRGANEVRRWLNGAMIHEFITQTLGVARWSATTPRGLTILDRLVARTPHVVAAWREFDPYVFERL